MKSTNVLIFILQVFFVVPKKNRIKRAQARSHTIDVDVRMEREQEHPSISHRYGVVVKHQRHSLIFYLLIQFEK